MKLIIGLGIFLLSLSIIQFDLGEARVTNQTCVKARLVRVIDGDTIKVVFRVTGTGNRNGRPRRIFKTESIRMAYIDAPEMRQKYGRKSKRKLKKLLRRSRNKLCIVGQGRDRYGRMLGIVFKNNHDINRKMVAKGHAWCYRNKCPAQYKQDQKVSKRLKKGLWASRRKPIAPWKWRKTKKNRFGRRKSKRNPKCKKAKLIRIIDGDTIIVKFKKRLRRFRRRNSFEKIRMTEIDAPETRQLYGRESTHHLRSLMRNATNQNAKFCVKSYGRGFYRRILGVVYLNKVDINLQMIKDGFAWCYRRKCRKSYKKAMKKAKKLQKGLWSTTTKPIAPWKWRKQSKRRSH